MIKSNKLPLKKIQMLNTFRTKDKKNGVPDPTDTTTTVQTSITSTHIFNK
jgi:hypothetical protein